MRQLDENDARYDAAIPDEKAILTAAKQIFHIYEGDVTDAKLPSPNYNRLHALMPAGEKAL